MYLLRFFKQQHGAFYLWGQKQIPKIQQISESSSTIYRTKGLYYLLGQQVPNDYSKTKAPYVLTLLAETIILGGSSYYLGRR